MNGNEVLMEVKNLKKWFPVSKGFFSKEKDYVKAVDDISFTVYQKETLGLVGESGCGKSTLARTILRLIEPSGGEVLVHGNDFLKLNRQELASMRKNMQIIFQDPYGSLHPKMTIRKILRAPMDIARYGTPSEREARVKELIEKVDLKQEHLDRYPHEFSGGQRQRIVIARALATNPEFVICDEPVSALDVSVRSQILNLLEDLQQQMGLTYLFISHDLSVVEHFCDRIIVMYLGKVMEMADTTALFSNPTHPYTQALLSAVRHVYEEERSEQILLEGDVPSPVNPPQGCRFHTRCPYASEKCQTEPPLTDIGSGHFVACHLCRKE